MVDPERLNAEEREVWDQMFPDGFYSPLRRGETRRFRLWSYAYACSWHLGYVPAVVNEVLRPEDYEAIAAYYQARRRSVKP